MIDGLTSTYGNTMYVTAECCMLILTLLLVHSTHAPASSHVPNNDVEPQAVATPEPATRETMPMVPSVAVRKPRMPS